MGLSSSLVARGEGSLPSSFDGLRKHLPLEWIRASLEKHGVATVRKRKLSVENVVWLIVGMALFRNRSITEIIDRLDLVLPDSEGKRQGVAKAAIPPARDRLGVEPMSELFEMTARRWAEELAESNCWRKLALFGIDGTTLRTADSDDNRGCFEGHAGSGYPLVRLATLLALRSRIAVDCAFDGCRTGEAPLAEQLLVSVPDNSLTIMDRYYHNYAIWHMIQSGGEDRHWLVRGRDDLRAWKTLDRLGPGDELAEIEVSAQTRSRHPHLNFPKTLKLRVIRYRRPGFKTRTLLTSLLDHTAYPAKEIVELYRERWEIELAYDELKTQTLESNITLRSQSPDRVRQELLGLMIAYNLVRREMAGIAEKMNLPANRISFQATLTMMRDLFFWAEVASPGKLPAMLAEMRLRLGTFVLPERRARSYPRITKMRVSKYPVTAERRRKSP